jgi:hypothetical protein
VDPATLARLDRLSERLTTIHRGLMLVAAGLLVLLVLLIRG